MTGLICLAYVAGWTAGSFGIFPFPPPLTLRLSPKQRLVTTQTGTFKAETCLGVLVFSQGKVPVLYSGLGICEAGARRSLSFLIPLLLTLLASVFLRAMVGRAWEMEWEGSVAGRCPGSLSLAGVSFSIFSGPSSPWRAFLPPQSPFLGLRLPPLLPRNMATACCLASELMVLTLPLAGHCLAGGVSPEPGTRPGSPEPADLLGGESSLLRELSWLLHGP